MLNKISLFKRTEHTQITCYCFKNEIVSLVYIFSYIYILEGLIMNNKVYGKRMYSKLLKFWFYRLFAALWILCLVGILKVSCFKMVNLNNSGDVNINSIRHHNSYFYDRTLSYNFLEHLYTECFCLHCFKNQILILITFGH